MYTTFFLESIKLFHHIQDRVEDEAQGFTVRRKPVLMMEDLGNEWTQAGKTMGKSFKTGLLQMGAERSPHGQAPLLGTPETEILHLPQNRIKISRKHCGKNM